MTSSTVNAEKQPAPASKPKRQGPIRTEAIIPFVIIAALVWGYFYFFFDGHLRRGLEYIATQGNGAEVNIAKVETSVWNASLAIHDIQVTDADVPTRNLVQIGSVDFAALWDGLLRGKVVIDRADILDIQVLSPRAKPGRVLPKDPEAVGLTDKLLAGIKNQFEGNVLGDLAALAEGADPGAQLSKLDDELKSSARIASLKTELAQKEQDWKNRIAALPKSETLSALEARLGKVKTDKFKDVAELQASLKELQAIRDEIDANVRRVQDSGQSLTRDVGGFGAVYAELDRAVKQDVADLQAHFRLPKLDAQVLANVLFGPDLFAKVADARGYMDKARAYMPPKRSAEEKMARRLQPHERAEGRNYSFGRPNAYPKFWLKQANIRSKSGSGPFAGDLAGTLTDLSSDPPLIGRPMVLRMQGDFPGLDIHDTRLELTVDHTTTEPVERLTALVGRYGVAGRSLVNSGEVQLGFDKALGRSAFEAELRGEQVSLRLENEFTQPVFEVKAKSPVAQEIISGAVNSVTAVNVNARVTGSWAKLDWYLATNLGEALEKGFRKQIQAKLEQAQARIQAMVEQRIADERRKLEEQYATAQSSVKSQIAAKQAEVDKLKTQLDQAKARAEQQKTQLLKTNEQKVQKEADKLLNDLRKRF